MCETAKESAWGTIFGCEGACTAANTATLCAGEYLGKKRGGAKLEDVGLREKRELLAKENKLFALRSHGVSEKDRERGRRENFEERKGRLNCCKFNK